MHSVPWSKLSHACCSRNFCRKTAGGLLIRENQGQPGSSGTVPVWCQCPRAPFQEEWSVLDAAVCLIWAGLIRAGSPRPWWDLQMHLAKSVPGGAAEPKCPGSFTSSWKSFSGVWNNPLSQRAVGSRGQQIFYLLLERCFCKIKQTKFLNPMPFESTAFMYWCKE